MKSIRTLDSIYSVLLTSSLYVTIRVECLFILPSSFVTTISESWVQCHTLDFKPTAVIFYKKQNIEFL